MPSQQAVQVGQKFYNKTGQEFTAQGVQDIGGGQQGQFLSGDYSLSRPVINQTTTTQAQQTPSLTPQINRPVLQPQQTQPSFQEQFASVGYTAPKSLEQIREEERRQIQAQIDATNKIFDEELNKIRQQGRQQEEVARGQAAFRGLAGTPFQTTARAGVQEFTQRQETALAAERAARLADVNDKANQRAIQRAQFERQQTGIESQQFLENQRNARIDARTDFLDLAKGGINFSEIPDQTKTQLLRESGYDEFTARAVYNANLPETQREDIKYQTINNRIVGYRFNPETNSLETFQSEAIGEAPEDGIEYSQTVTDSGQIVFTPKKFDPSKPIKDQIIVYGKEGEFNDGMSSGDEVTPSSDMKEYFLAKKEGFDGNFVDWKKQVEQDFVSGDGIQYTKEQNKAISDTNDKISKNDTYKTVVNALGYADGIVATLSQNTGTGDIAAINQFQKMIDDGAVTRDQDVRLIQSAQSLIDKLNLQVKKIKEGDQLSSELRQEMLDTTDALYQGKVDNLLNDPFVKATSKSLERQGISLEDTIISELSNLQRGKLTEGQALEVPVLNQSYQNLDNLLQNQPEFEDFIRNYSEKFPEDSDEDVLQFIESSQGFKNDLNTSKKGSTGMRTDRHNNPVAFTTDIAKQAGLKEGVDYEVGDSFPNNPNFKTARLLKNPVDTTIKVIDKIGFYTNSGAQRWSHTAMSKSKWNSLSREEKAAIIKNMYKKEGNQGVLNKFFA